MGFMNPASVCHYKILEGTGKSIRLTLLIKSEIFFDLLHRTRYLVPNMRGTKDTTMKKRD